MTYRYIYKITCTAGDFKDKFYFGQRTTTKLPNEDKYKGSGKLILDYYKKHPNDYVKEIISFHKTKDELNQAEYDIIKPWLGNPICLNLKRGGEGGSAKGTNKGIIHDENWNKKTSETNWLKHLDNPKYNESYKKWRESVKKSNHSHIVTEEERKKRSEKLKGRIITEEWRNNISIATRIAMKKPEVRQKLLNRTTSEETKEKQRILRIGRKWMTDGNVDYHLLPDKWEYFINLGFVFGRTKGKRQK